MKDVASVLELPGDLLVGDLKGFENNKGWQVVQAYLSGEVTDLYIDYDSATTMEEVAKLQGTINGIKLALQAPETIKQNAIYDKDNPKIEEETEDE